MPNNFHHWIVRGAALALALSANAQEPAPSTAPPITTDYLALQSAQTAPASYTVSVLSETPHDPDAFTQGLLLNDNSFIESLGLYGRSELREVDVASGQVIRSKPLPHNHFGEGVALVDDRLIQLTWKENIAHVWDLQTFEKIGQFTYSGEGWGLAYNGTQLVMSNGTNKIVFRDPDTFKIVREIHVTHNGQPVNHLNELEYAEGTIWANVWMQDFIVGIDPETGNLRAIVDARSLRPRLLRQPGRPLPEVLNGIAYNGDEGTYYLTGKNWPTMFEVQFVHE